MIRVYVEMKCSISNNLDIFSNGILAAYIMMLYTWDKLTKSSSNCVGRNAIKIIIIKFNADRMMNMTSLNM